MSARKYSKPLWIVYRLPVDCLGAALRVAASEMVSAALTWT
jgi:hypothetical protein